MSLYFWRYVLPATHKHTDRASGCCSATKRPSGSAAEIAVLTRSDPRAFVLLALLRPFSAAAGDVFHRMVSVPRQCLGSWRTRCTVTDRLCSKCGERRACAVLRMVTCACSICWGSGKSMATLPRLTASRPALQPRQRRSVLALPLQPAAAVNIWQHCISLQSRTALYSGPL